MTNSMDCIQVAYGRERLTRFDLGNKRYHLVKKMLGYPTGLDLLKLSEKDKKQLKIKVKKLMPTLFPKKTLPLPEFLTLKPETLTEDEQRIQKCLKALYQINGHSKDPLFAKFPKKDDPLLIDCTILPSESCWLGQYWPSENIVILNKLTNVHDARLMDALAHELKHGQQSYNPRNFNNYQLHQLGFLSEAQARACGERACAICFQRPTFNQIFTLLFSRGEEISEECKAVRDQLEFFPSSNKKSFYQYKDEYDTKMPIHFNDKGLEKIPESFGFSAQDEKVLLECLKSIPKTARTPDNLLLQALINQKKESFVKILDSKTKTGKSVLSRKGLSHAIEQLLEFVDKGSFDDQKAEFLKAVVKTKWVDWEDVAMVPGKPHLFTVYEGETLNPEQTESRLRYLKTILTSKDKSGKMIIPFGDIEFDFMFSKEELAESHPEFTEQVEKMLASVKKPQLRKTLASLPRKVSDKSRVPTDISKKKQKEI